MLDRSENILDWSDVCWTGSRLTVDFLGSWTCRGQVRPVQDKSEGSRMKMDWSGKAELVQDTSVSFLEKNWTDRESWTDSGKRQILCLDFQACFELLKLKTRKHS